MQLTAEERAMLGGAEGPAVQKAMQIVVALAEIYEAERLVPVSSAQVAGVSYKNLGDAGLEFLEEWAAQGARVRVPTFMNPAGMDLERWREMGVAPEFARQQQRVIEALRTMGVELTCTCTPYLVGHVPKMGEHLAWSESSAVSFVNSVLGARSNREGGPSALAAAITGRTAAYGLHLVENRRATHIVEVRCPLRSEADYGALGYLVGRQVGDGVPYFRLWSRNLAERRKKLSRALDDMDKALCDLERLEKWAYDVGLLEETPAPLVSLERPPPELGAPERPPREENWMALAAAMAASGAVALYHVEGVTPEARWALTRSPGPCGRASLHSDVALPTIVIDSLDEGYAALNSPLDEIDFVSLGCPHSTPAELERAATLLQGKQVKATLWITTSRGVRKAAQERGLVERIEAAGGKVFTDTCLVVAPVETMGFKAMATNSAKAAFYAPAHSGLQRRFGSMEQCIEAALSGRWTGRDSSPAAQNDCGGCG